MMPTAFTHDAEDTDFILSVASMSEVTLLGNGLWGRWRRNVDHFESIQSRYEVIEP
jgi:hypothetical protein